MGVSVGVHLSRVCVHACVRVRAPARMQVLLFPLWVHVWTEASGVCDHERPCSAHGRKGEGEGKSRNAGSL